MNGEHIAHELREINLILKTGFDWFRLHANLATKDDLKQLGDKIMSAVSDYVTATNAHLDQIDASLTGLQTSSDKIDTDVVNLQGDVKTLNDIITNLQNNPGPISPADQALLDTAQARVATMADRVAALKTKTDAQATALDALDALTPPPAPPTTP